MVDFRAKDVKIIDGLMQFYNKKKAFPVECYLPEWLYIDNLVILKLKIQNELHSWFTAASVNSWDPKELYTRGFSVMPFRPQPLKGAWYKQKATFTQSRCCISFNSPLQLYLLILLPGLQQQIFRITEGCSNRGQEIPTA